MRGTDGTCRQPGQPCAVRWWVSQSRRPLP